MKISVLEINKLHGLYNYHVEFNPDLTFLYGLNGCGKTTVLNIIEAIISGRLYELYAWNFDCIKLDYYDDNSDEKNIYTIYVYYIEENLCVKWKNENITVVHDTFVRTCENTETYEDFVFVMDSRYPVLRSIKNEFNYVYLPLNRNSTNRLNIAFFERYGRLKRRRSFYNEWDDRVLSREERIGRTAMLVRKKYAEASARVAEINDEFRNKVLKSLLSTNTIVTDTNFANFLTDSIKRLDVDSIHNQYFKLLNSLGILDEAEKLKFNKFFSDYKNYVDQFINKNCTSKGVPISLSILFGYHEIEKMRTVIPLAQEMEAKKARVLERIKTFIEVMNSFIQNHVEDKRLYLDETGKIKFWIEGKGDVDITTDNLSSGEKQLLIFFANLIFGVEQGSSSIFVVDEPELSLHLSWQKDFVEKANQVNENMQLIFATHAPEIVGKYRSKMFKLEKKSSLR